MGQGRNQWKEEEGEKNEGLKVQWRTKVTKWQCLTATSILKWCSCQAVLLSIDFFFPWSTERKNNSIQLKQILAAGISPLLAAIKVNTGATLIKVLLSPSFSFSFSSSSPRMVWGMSLMDWSPCSAGSLFISSTQKPLSSAKLRAPLHHISLHCCQLFMITPAQIQGHAMWKIICVKAVVWRWKIVKWREDVTWW